MSFSPKEVGILIEKLRNQKNPFIIIIENYIQVIPLINERYEIGTSKDCDIPLKTKKSVGKIHAAFINYEGKYYLRHLDPQTKTIINSQKISYSELKSRDKIEFGGIICIFFNPEEDPQYINSLEELLSTYIKRDFTEKFKLYFSNWSLLRYPVGILAILFFSLIVGSYFYNFYFYGSPIKVLEIYYQEMYKSNFPKVISLLSPENRGLKYIEVFVKRSRPPFDTYDPSLNSKVSVKGIVIEEVKNGINVRSDIYLNNDLVTTETLHMIKHWGRWQIHLNWTIEDQIKYERDILEKHDVFKVKTK